MINRLKKIQLTLYGFSVLLGTLLLVVTLYLYAAYGSNIGMEIVKPLLWVVLAVMANLLLEGLARKVYFGARISLHQSLSFEIIMQLLRLVNPFMPLRGFEYEFLRRETDMQDTQAYGWIALRYDWVAAVLVAGICVAGLFFSHYSLPVIFGLGVFFVIGYSRLSFGTSRRTALFIWDIGKNAIGLYLFLCIFSPFLNRIEIFIIYYFSVCAFERPVIPFNIGVVELPAAFIMNSNFFVLLVAYHLFRLVPLMILGCIYLPRYKFCWYDFFDVNIIAALHRRRRPAGGWTVEGEKPESDPDLSIVIPAYNEAERLPAFLQDVKDYIKQSDKEIEVLVVDDGSSDRTADIVKQEAAVDSRIKLCQLMPNQGKGKAVSTGMLEAKGYYILYVDADGATPISELSKFENLMKRDLEIMIGSRRVDSGNDVARDRKGLRSLMGMFFYKLVNYLAVPGICDTQCGFKLFRYDVAKVLFRKMHETGWAFDVEVLYLAQLLGYGIYEQAVNWEEKAGSKINPIKDSIKMFVAIFRIRKDHHGFLTDNSG